MNNTPASVLEAELDRRHPGVVPTRAETDDEVRHTLSEGVERFGFDCLAFRAELDEDLTLSLECARGCPGVTRLHHGVVRRNAPPGREAVAHVRCHTRFDERPARLLT